MTRPASSDHHQAPEDLFEGFFDGTLGREDATRLMDAIRSDAETGEQFFRTHQEDLLLRLHARSEADPLHLLSRAGDPSEGASGEPQTAPLFAVKFPPFPTLPTLSPSAGDKAEETAERRLPPRPAAESTRKTKRQYNHYPAVICATLLAIILTVLIYDEWRPSKNRESGAVAQKPPTPAVLTRAVDVQWSAKHAPPKPGTPLFPGTISFESGMIELLFASGVRGIVEGPAEFILMDESEVFCRKGRWSVTVPKQGKGFEIQTSHLVVRDLGTRFYADVEKDRCDVRVVEGKVETERSDGKRTVFRTGSGASYRGGDLAARLSGAFTGFVTRSEMRRRDDEFRARTARPDAPSVRTLEASAIRKIDFARKPISDATVSGGKIVDGPTSKEKAFRFAGPKDCIRVRPVGRLSAMTAVIRVRIDRLDQDVNPILMSEESQKHGLVLQIRSSGIIAAGVRYQSSRHRGVFESPVVLTDELLGRWVSLAMVFDAEKQSLELYFEGDPVFSATLPRPVSPKFDTLNVGCWKMHAGENGLIRHLNGEIGKLLIFDRTLSPEEIRLLQEH